MNEKTLDVVMQGFFGNRTFTTIKEKNIDKFIQGILDDKLNLWLYPIDRTIVKIPNTKNLVIIYNKYKEIKRLEDKEEALRIENEIMTPCVKIPELDLEIYSSCLICRIDEDGTLSSLEKEDFDKFMKYLEK